MKVLAAIERCRTAALGGHRDRCARCGHTTAISYNSCRNRHCPKCQTNARDKWLAARKQELLPVPYGHVVFTLPHQIAPLAFHNKKMLYALLFRASSATLLEIAADPKHLGAEIGFLSVLHTWGQNLLHHPHVHCVVPAGGLSPDHKTWVHPRYSFLLPVKVPSRVFRGKFVAGLKQAFQKDELCLPGGLKPLAQKKTFHSEANGNSKPIAAASAANAGGFLQTSLSEVTRRSNLSPNPTFTRRVTPDKVLAFVSSLTFGSYLFTLGMVRQCFMESSTSVSRGLFPGALEMMILESLRRQPAHGYALMQHIQQRSQNLLQVEEGSLYPALQRLLKAKLVKAEWTVSASTNRRVRVYQITATGLRHLDREISSFDRMLEGIQMVLGPARRATSS